MAITGCLKFSAIAIGLALVACPGMVWQRSAAASDGSVTLVAGGPGRGNARDVAIGDPAGMAIRGGSLYVVDSNSNVVRVIDTVHGVADVTAGYGGSNSDGDRGPAIMASLSSPIDVTIDGNGRLCFSEQYRIRCVEADGTIRTIAGTGTADSTGDGGPALSADIYPDGIAFGADGTLYLAEPHAHRVRRITPAGIIEPFAGTGVAGFAGDGGPAIDSNLYQPYDVATDPDGSVYVADSGNGRIRKITPDGTITTICGGGTRQGLAADGFPALEANCGTLGIALHPDGSVYFSSTRSLWRVDPNGILRRVAGNFVLGDSGDGGPARDALVNPTRGLVIDPAGIVYLGDSETRRVRYIDTSGVIHPLAGNGTIFLSGDSGAATEAQMNYPWDVATDRAGGFYVADGDRIRHVRADGTIVTLAVTGYGLTAIDVLPGGDPIVVDIRSQQVRRILPDGTIVGIAGTFPRSDGSSGDGGPATFANLNAPSGVAVGPDGSVYIGDSQNNRVRRVDPQGRIDNFAGLRGGSDAEGIPAVQARLNYPTVVTADASGNVYFAEPYSHRVRRVDRDGIIRTYAGTGIEGFSGDGGPANLAQIGYVNGIRVDEGGNLLMAEGNRIRIVDRHGVIATLLGDGTCCSNSEPQTASAARVGPHGLSIDSDGRILFAELYGRRIRRLDVPDLCPQIPGLDVTDANGNGVGDDCECTLGDACPDDGNPCTSDVCDGNGACIHAPAHVGTVCRATAGDCDVAETCDGISTTCPDDAFAAASVVCRDSTGECDVADRCTGTSPTCPTDVKVASGTPCSPDSEACTVDACDDRGNCAHTAGNVGAVCRASAGDCDVAEQCDGVAPTCPQNRFRGADVVCRDAAGECDLAEHCTGVSGACPIDARAHAGMPCASDSLICTADVCDGTKVTCTHPAGNAGVTCRSATDACDVAESCDGLHTACPADTGLPDSDSDGKCDAQDPCTNITGAQDFVSPPRSKLVLSRINTDPTPGNDKLTITAVFDLPLGRSFSDLRPHIHGARVVLEGVEGTQLIDVMLPSGAYTPTTRVGWRPGGNGKVWTFTNNGAPPLNGIVKLTLTDGGQVSSRRRVKVVVNGKNGVYPVAPADSPVRVTLTLGDTVDAAAGMCGESAYTASDCNFNGPANTLKCQR